ncbi:MAG: hypothetical protein WB421_13900 [Terriglobales bacterium]
MNKAYVQYKDTVTVTPTPPVPVRYNPYYTTQPYFRRLGNNNVSIGDTNAKNKNGVLAIAALALIGMIAWQTKK